MNLYLFMGKSVFGDDFDDYNVYVRCESLASVVPIVVDHYGWDDDETAEEIIEDRIRPDWDIKLIKTYPEPAPAAGAISFSEVERLLHAVL